VPSSDADALANALERLIRDQWLRFTFGNEGRTRVDRYFQVETTVAPLMALFDRVSEAAPAAAENGPEKAEPSQVAYIIDRWPDPELPLLAEELTALEQRGVPVTAFVRELAGGTRLDARAKETATKLVFLPDPLVVEAEWEANRATRLELEDDRANEKDRAPAGIFLEQARFAIALRTLMRHRNISHLHAVGSQSLLCGLMLKKLLGRTLSATIEASPVLPEPVIRNALKQCVGGRVSDTKMAAQSDGTFLREPRDGFLRNSMRAMSRAVGAEFTGRATTWSDWAELLVRWK
jgi:hypothetical protein